MKINSGLLFFDANRGIDWYRRLMGIKDINNLYHDSRINQKRPVYHYCGSNHCINGCFNWWLKLTVKRCILKYAEFSLKLGGNYGAI